MASETFEFSIDFLQTRGVLKGLILNQKFRSPNLDRLKVDARRASRDKFTRRVTITAPDGKICYDFVKTKL